MNRVYIITSGADTFVDELAGSLAGAGYAVLQVAPELRANRPLQRAAIEPEMRGSIAIVVVWSAALRDDEFGRGAILLAQGLKKPIFIIVTDGTEPPNTFASFPTIDGRARDGVPVRQLLEHIAACSDDSLLIELLTGELIRERNRGLAVAGEYLKQRRLRDHIVLLIQHLASSDPFEKVRKQAQSLLSQQAAVSAPYEFGVSCSKNHITYFDKRVVCSLKSVVKRDAKRFVGSSFDELYLECGTCGEDLKVYVDCEGYK
jgi:hypothetical protein